MLLPVHPAQLLQKVDHYSAKYNAKLIYNCKRGWVLMPIKVVQSGGLALTRGWVFTWDSVVPTLDASKFWPIVLLFENIPQQIPHTALVHTYFANKSTY